MISRPSLNKVRQNGTTNLEASVEKPKIEKTVHINTEVNVNNFETILDEENDGDTDSLFEGNTKRYKEILVIHSWFVFRKLQ